MSKNTNNDKEGGGKSKKHRPPRVYRTKEGRPYIRHKSKRVYLNFGKKTNDLSNVSIMKLFLKYMDMKKRVDKRKTKTTTAKVIYPDTDRIELENRQRVDSQVKNYLRDKYERINEMDKEEEKKKKEARERAEEQKRADEAKQRQDIADAAERAADITRAIAREQKLQSELKADRRATQNIRLIQGPLGPPPQQIQGPRGPPPGPPRGPPLGPPQAPPQIQGPPGPPRGPPLGPPPQQGPLGPPPQLLKTKEQKEAEQKERKENMDLLRKAGYAEADVKGMSKTALNTTATGIRAYEKRGIAIDKYKKDSDKQKEDMKNMARAAEDKERMIKISGALSRNVDPTIQIKPLADALRKKLTDDGYTKLGAKQSKTWIASAVVKYKIDVGQEENKMKRRLAEYVGLVQPEQKGNGYERTLVGFIDKKYTGAQIKKYLNRDEYKTKTKKADLVVMLLNKMNTDRKIDEKISKELDIDTAEGDEPPKTKQRGKGSGEGKGLTTTQIEEVMKDEKQYIGTVASDEIKTLKPKGSKYGFIMNTDKASQPGQHWIAVYLDLNGDKTVEVYDSLGTYEPTKEFLELIKTLVDKAKLDHYLLLKVNKIKRQSDTSDTCGWFGVKFFKERFRGNRFKFSTGFTELKEDEIQKYKKQNGYGFDTFI